MIAGMTRWMVNEDEAGLTVLEFLQQRLPGAPTGYLRQLLRGGKVRQNGQVLGDDSSLSAGAQVAIPDSRRLEELRTAAERSVEVLCETDSLLVAFKPAGLAVHLGVGHEDNLTQRVQELMRQRRAPFKVAPVHRLDVETSGPVIFGKGARAIAGLGRQFMDRQVEKVYFALAAGELAASGQLTSPVPAKEKLKTAAASFQRIEARGGYSLLELQLHTGRTHQIRRQLADAGHPLAGDRRYRGPSPRGLSRLFLHCTKLVLRDPFDHTTISISSSLPAELVALLAALGMGAPTGGQSPCRNAPDQQHRHQ